MNPVGAGDVHLDVPADPSSPVPVVASRKRQRGPQPVALVGFREWIFSENSGADHGLGLREIAREIFFESSGAEQV